MNERMHEEVKAIPTAEINPQVHEVITQSFDDIDDYIDPDLLAFLDEKGIKPEREITANDFEAIRARAKILLQESTVPMTAETALISASYDRFNLTGEIGAEILKALPVEVLRALFYGETRIMFTEEEIGLFKESPLPFKEWGLERQEAKENLQ